MGKREFFFFRQSAAKDFEAKKCGTRGGLFDTKIVLNFSNPRQHTELKFILMGAVWSLIMFF